MHWELVSEQWHEHTLLGNRPFWKRWQWALFLLTLSISAPPVKKHPGCTIELLGSAILLFSLLVIFCHVHAFLEVGWLSISPTHYVCEAIYFKTKEFSSEKNLIGIGRCFVCLLFWVFFFLVAPKSFQHKASMPKPSTKNLTRHKDWCLCKDF